MSCTSRKPVFDVVYERDGALEKRRLHAEPPALVYGGARHIVDVRSSARL